MIKASPKKSIHAPQTQPEHNTKLKESMPPTLSLKSPTPCKRICYGSQMKSTTTKMISAEIKIKMYENK